MLTEPRRQQILQALRRDGQVVARTIAAELSVSEDTIRRDLRELARQGVLQRVHGGAVLASPAIADLEARSALAPDEKRALGAEAANLIEPGQVVLLDGGTSTLELVRALPRELRATIITHSPVIAAALIPYPNIEVVIVGGRLFKHSGVSVGAAAHEAISAIRADTYFMGATGIHAEYGVTTGDLEESHIKRALMAAAAETVLLATSDKLGRVSAYRVSPLSAISTLLTPATATPELLASLRASGVQVRVVALAAS